MLHHVKLFCLIFLLSSFSYAQLITNIEISGNKKFSNNEVLQFSGINSGNKFYLSIIDTIKKNILNNFAKAGYLSSEINIDVQKEKPDNDSSNVKLFIKVVEGKPAIIRTLKINSAPEDSAKIYSIFGFLEGSEFNKYLIEENIDEALKYYEDNGFPFTVISFLQIEIVKDSIEGEDYVDLLMKVEKKSRSTIDEIEVSGNSSTKDYVIVRELRLNKGELYSQKKINDLPKKLNKLRFFEPVTTPTYYFDKDGKGILRINVKEKQTNNFDGILGYVPGVREGEKGYFTGLANVSIRNLFGTGRAFAIRWQQLNRNSQELELRYLEPWLLGYPFNVSFNLFQRKQDTTYVQRKLEGVIDFLASEEVTAGLILSTEEIIPTLLAIPRFTVYNSSLMTAGLNLRFDTSDDPYSPTSGFVWNNTYTFSRKKINGPIEYLTTALKTNINLQRFMIDFSYFHQIFSKQIISLGVHGRELRGASFEESDLFRLGGTLSLRGFREQQFLGSRIAWTNLEYRYLITRRSYIFAFWDNGYFMRAAEPDKNILKNEGYRMGYGLGLQVETGLGMLGVSYALAKGDPFSEGKIHFGIINEF
ncbi:MAG TPA: BamA/TamA family outer membrane protein [Ignavibacteriaceae bacterium]|nr:BamA/TamA family outer membrane protein [Ignavibacteriaceae bacterium]